MHLDEETIQRLVAGELPAAFATSVREHLAACHDCRRRVSEAEQEEAQVDLLLRHLDHPAPPVATGEVISKASAREFEWSRVAVAALLVAGIAGAAFAVPGSPLRAWLGAVVVRIGGHSDGTSPAPPAPSAIPGAGIAVAPGPELVIVFTTPQPQGQIRVSLTDGADVVVQAPNGAATFSSAVDRLEIDNRGATATFDIQIPHAAARVEIRVGDVRVFLKEGPRITAGTTMDSAGPYLLPLAPSGR